jgi:hypothetical protein
MYSRKMSFWAVWVASLVESDRRFSGACCLHLGDEWPTFSELLTVTDRSDDVLHVGYSVFWIVIEAVCSSETLVTSSHVSVQDRKILVTVTAVTIVIKCVVFKRHNVTFVTQLDYAVL